MRTRLEPFSKSQGVQHGSSVDGTCLFVLEVAVGRYKISIWKNKDEELGSHSDKEITIESSSGPSSLGRIAVLDAHLEFVFASLADRRRLHVVPMPIKPYRISNDRPSYALDFEGELFALKSFRIGAASQDCSGVTAAVSSLGEVLLLQPSGPKPEIKSRKLEVPPVDRVVHVTEYQQDHLIVVASRNSKLLVYAVHIKRRNKWEDVDIEVLPEVALPPAPEGATALDIEDGILGFAIQKSCAVLLYRGGFAHFLSPSQSSFTSENEECYWFTKNPTESGKRHASLATLRHAMRLSKSRNSSHEVPKKADRSQLQGENNCVTSLGSGFFAIGYGEYISVWDGLYCTGYSYVQAPQSIDFLFCDSQIDQVLAVSKEAVHHLKPNEIHGSAGLTLGAAIKHRGVCDPIVMSVQQNIESAPLRSQPVTVGLAQAAAEGAGQIDRIYRGLMKKEEEQEVKEIRALLSKDLTPSAHKLIETIHVYFKHKRTIRRGNHGNEMDLGLAKLPSERLAAVAVARCVYEISCGNSDYVVPFIDMIGTGVVSSEAVVSVLHVSDSWNMGPDAKSMSLSSICDPLMSGDAYLNALEAVLSRIADLPERDVVRIFQFAVQLFVKARHADEEEDCRKWRRKCLLSQCMVHRVQKERLVQIVRKLPFTDVVTCIDVLAEVLSEGDLPARKGRPKVPRHIATGQFVNDGIKTEEALVYRGLGNWVDKDYQSQVQRREIDPAEACVKWMSCLVDAHVTALIMDESGQEVASRVLGLIQEHRKESEALNGIAGLVSHLVERNAIPGDGDSLYKVCNHEVPIPMALE